MAKNIQSLQLLRNNNLFNDKDTAVSGLTSGTTQDGVIKLARYQEDGKIKTIFGIYHTTDQGSGYTIYDGDSEVIKGLTDRIDALEGKVTGDVASQISQAIDNLKGGATTSADTLGELEKLINNEVTERKAAITQAGKDASGYTDSKINGLNATITGSGATTQMTVAVGQAAGQITAVTVNDSNVATKSSVDTAKSEAISSAKSYTDGKINGLAASGITANQVVTNVTQTDGKITPTGSSLGSVQLGAYTANTGATGEIASTDTLAAALNKITNKINTAAAAHDIKSNGKTINVTTSATGTNIDVNIKSGEHVLKSDGNEGLYTDIKLKKITTGLTANVQEKYQLVGSDGAVLGDPVQIYKDSALLSVALLHASGETLPTYDGTWHEILPESGQSEANLALCYAYSDASGATQVVAVPVGSFLRESEFSDGLQVNGGVVSVKRDTTSENFLTVSNNGIKLSGVQTAIDNAKKAAVSEAETAADSKIQAEIEKLDATVTGTGTTTQMTVAVGQTAGKITAVTVNDSNVATKSSVDTAKSEAISSAKSYTDTAKDELQGKIDAVSGAVSSVTNAVTSVSMTGGTAQITGHQLTIDTDASQIKMDGYAKGSTGNVAPADTINTAIAKLENKADNNATAIKQNKLTDESEGAIILGQQGDSGTSIKLGTLDAGTY